YFAGVHADGADAQRPEFLHRRQARAAQADDADIGPHRAFQARQRPPVAVFPDREVHAAIVRARLVPASQFVFTFAPYCFPAILARCVPPPPWTKPTPSPGFARNFSCRPTRSTSTATRWGRCPGAPRPTCSASSANGARSASTAGPMRLR